MPNKHAAMKDLRKNTKRALESARLKTHVKALTGRFQDLLRAGKSDEARAFAHKLQQILDKAGKRRVFHKNKARRQVSSAHKKLHKNMS